MTAPSFSLQPAVPGLVRLPDGLQVTEGIANANVPPLPPEQGGDDDDDVKIPRSDPRATITRLVPRSEYTMTGLQIANARRLIAHYQIVRLTPPGEHCVCSVRKNNNICRHSIVVGGFRLACHALVRNWGFDHTRLATTRTGQRLLISSQYDGFFVAADVVNPIMAALGLVLEATHVSAWMPGRALTVIVRKRPEGPDLTLANELSLERYHARSR